MKRLILHIVILQIATLPVFRGGFFAEFGKVSFLLEHFIQHSSESPGTTWLSFISLHYFEGAHPDDPDADSDRKLPFCAGHSGIDWIKAYEWQRYPQLLTGISEESPAPAFTPEPRIITGIPDGIFQPPRLS